MIEKPNYLIRHIREEDFENVIQLNAESGCTRKIHDLKIAFSIDLKGMFVVESLDTGEIIGSCVGTKLGNNLANIATYAVKLKFNNMGIGSEIWAKTIEHLGIESNIHLCAAEPMFSKYCKSFGSVIIDKKNIIAYKGKHNSIKYELLVNNLPNISVITVNEKNLNSVAEYDQNICGYNRINFLKQTLSESESVLLTAIDINNNDVIGYTKLAVNSYNNLLTQPLYANNIEIAELLLFIACKQMSKYKTEGLTISSWNPNNSGIDLISNKIGLIGTESVYKTLYTKQLPNNVCYEKIFGRTSGFVIPF